MLIVDDEPLIRSGLKNLIEWEVYGIEITGEAEDGTKAYKQIKQQQPDIALIDITMPNMSGLDLIEFCSHLEHAPKFIILSGYNDFEYVRKAIRFGAVNYLLKPVDTEELTNTIVSTVKLLDDEQTRNLQFKEGIQALKNDTLIRLLNRRIDAHELREKCNFLNLSFRNNSMRVGLIRPLRRHSENIITSSDIDFCQKFCRSSCPCYTAIDTSGTVIFIFKDQTHTLTETNFMELLEKCSQQLSRKLHQKFFCALGPNASSSADLPMSYYSALQLIEKKQAFEKVFPKDAPRQGGKDFEPNNSFHSDQIVQCLTKNDTEQLNHIINTYFQDISAHTSTADLETVKYTLVEMIIEMTRKLKSSMLTDSSIDVWKQKAFSLIRSADSFAVLQENMLVYFVTLADQFHENNHPKYSNLVKNALLYVRSNYHDCNLSIKTLAAQMNVNAAYLGRQFSMETKEYFSDYLNKIRVAQAVQLLNDTSWKTSKIAEAVGFANISYFYTIFKKITGISPGNYRSNV